MEYIHKSFYVLCYLEFLQISCHYVLFKIRLKLFMIFLFIVIITFTKVVLIYVYLKYPKYV